MIPIIIMADQIGLATLGYGTRFTGELDSLTRSAVRAYQQRRGLPITGNLLDPLTYDLIARDGEFVMHGLVGVIHPAGYKVFVDEDWDRGSFSAKGGWRSNSDRVAEVQIGYFECDRSTAKCSLSLAWITGHELSLGFPEVYKITSWDKAEIRGIKNDLCARSELVINRTHKTVKGTSTTTSPGPLCDILSATPIQYELYDGLRDSPPDVWNQHLVLSPLLQKLMDEAKGEKSSK
jgi:hypothetical protein